MSIENLKTFGKSPRQHLILYLFVAWITEVFGSIFICRAGDPDRGTWEPGLHESDQEWRGSYLDHMLTCSTDPFAEADEDTGDTHRQSQNYIHIRIQRMNFEQNLY